MTTTPSTETANVRTPPTFKIGLQRLSLALVSLFTLSLHAQQTAPTTPTPSSQTAVTNAVEIQDADATSGVMTNALSNGATNVAERAPAVPVVVSTNALSINVSTNDLVQARLEARLAELANDQRMDEALNAALTEQYEAILEQQHLAASARAKEAEFVKLREEAPEEMLRLQETLQQVEPVLPGEAEKLSSVGDLQALLEQYETELATARGRLSELQGLPQTRSDQRVELARQLVELRNRIEQAAAVESIPGEAAELTGARRLLSLAQRQVLRPQIAAKTQEIAYYDEAKDLLNAQIEQASQQVELLKTQVEAWRDFTARQRAAAAQAGMIQAGLVRREALSLAGNHELVVQVADANDQLLALRVGEKGLARRIEVTAQQLTEAQSDLKSIEESYQRISERIWMLEDAQVRVGKAIALLLRHELFRLRAYETPKVEEQAIAEEISATLSEAVQFQEDRFQLSNVQAEAKRRVLDYLERSATGADSNVETAVRNLLTARRDYLDALIADQNLLVSQLVSLKTTNRDLEETAEQYADFIQERILWLRSASPWSLQGFLDACGQLTERFPQEAWRYAGSALFEDLYSHIWLYVLIVVGWILLLVGRGRLQSALAELCEQADDRSLNSMSPTFMALGIVALVALTWAGWILLLGWRLSVCGSDTLDEFSHSMGRSLTGAGLAFWVIEFVRTLCRPGGVGETHLSWTPHNTRLVRRHFLWFIFALVPTRIVAEVVLWNLDAVRHLEQTLYAVAMLIALVFAHSMLHPVRGLQLGPVSASPSERGWFTWRRLLYGFAILVPIALAISALRGYYYSAWAIGLHIGGTVRLIMLVFLARSILYRWLLVLRRRMAVRLGEQHYQRKLQAKAGGEEAPATAPQKISLMEIIRQSQQLVRAGMVIVLALGLFGIWGDFIPALSALDRVPLKFWNQPAAARASAGQDPVVSTAESRAVRAPNQASPSSASETSDEEDATAASSESPPIALPGVAMLSDGGRAGAEAPADVGVLAEGVLSVADFLWALATIAITIVSVRNLPGLLQVLFLNRVELAPGVAYAIITVFRYSLMIIGALIVSATLGLSWSKVQWIAAAFSLGIAFGLQEIFANFISGLIILFERPVRVGDIVTVGEVSGNVTRINIRATTITDWDRKEYLVPNKDFITSKLLNWTLSDPVTRVLLTVGIAYGSDTEKAQQLLLEAAAECETVMKDPAPRAVFWEFGDNSLNFRLYVFLPRRDFFLDVLHTLTTSINRKFAQAGISIAFPQRDVHLDQIGPIKVEVLPNPAKEEHRES